jgi:hypothetical protein
LGVVPPPRTRRRFRRLTMAFNPDRFAALNDHNGTFTP